MKMLSLGVLSVFSVLSSSAMAGEGQAGYFEQRIPGIAVTAPYARADVGSAAYPDITGRAGSRLSVTVTTQQHAEMVALETVIRSGNAFMSPAH